MLTKERLIETILESVLEANHKQFQLSGGYWLFEAGVEGLIQSICAYRLHELMNESQENGGNVFLECNFSEILVSSGAIKKRGSIPHKLRGKKRIDILLTRPDGTPMVPIEIKRDARSDGFFGDIQRILLLLSRTDTRESGSIKFGAACAFVYGSGDDEETAAENLKHNIKISKQRVQNLQSREVIEFYSRSKEPENFENYGYWAAGAVCVYLRRKRESG